MKNAACLYGLLLPSLLTCFGKPLVAKEFCALTVIVDAPDSLPIDGVIIDLIDSRGVVEENHRTEGAKTTFCDLTAGLHSIRVGSNECFPVIVSNISMLYGKPQTLHVWLNECLIGETLNTGCEVLLRIKNAAGLPIKAAEIAEFGKGHISDAFGRVGVGLSQGSTRVYVVTAKGFIAQVVNLSCPSPAYIDKTVTLRVSDTARTER